MGETGSKQRIAEKEEKNVKVRKKEERKKA